MKERREIVAKKHKTISKRRRAKILSVNLSSLYLKPKKISMENVNLMNEIQDSYAVFPFKGYRRICNDLNDFGHNVNHKRVLRLMRIMRLQAVYPKKNLSKRRQGDAVFPYLLKGKRQFNPIFF
jgi:putative transposase